MRTDGTFIHSPHSDRIAFVPPMRNASRLSGPPGLRQITGFHDEALSGEWKGYRSSRLGLQYRVIYRVLAAEMCFQVISLTVHDNRRT
jgi:addiction module RelE/StbE family toxin